MNVKHFKTRSLYCSQPGCAKSFVRKDNWRRHMSKKHGIDPQSVTEDYMGDLATDEE